MKSILIFFSYLLREKQGTKDPMVQPAWWVRWVLRENPGLLVNPVHLVLLVSLARREDQVQQGRRVPKVQWVLQARLVPSGHLDRLASQAREVFLGFL